MNNDTTTQEIWKPVVGYEGYYEVSNLGRVKRIVGRYKGRILRGSIPSGYHLVNLCKQGEIKGYGVHRLVAISFLGQPPTPEHQVNHINAVKHDNRVENLEWVTPQRNVEHADQMGLRNHFFTPKKLQEKIHDLLQQKPRLTKRKIAEICGCSPRLVDVETKDKHRPVSPLWDKNLLLEANQASHMWTRIQNDDVEEIKRLLSEKEFTQRQIAKMYNVHESVISLIKHDKYYNRGTNSI